jgi:phosphatidate cytidylyltransferase
MGQRLVTAFVLSIAALAVLFSPSAWPMAVFAGTFGIAGFFELRRLISFNPWIAGLVGALAVFILVGRELIADAPVVQVSAIAVILSLVGASSAGYFSRETSKGNFEASVFWLASPLAAAVLLHSLGAGSLAGWWVSPLFLIILPLTLGDSAAYFVGKAIGKTKLAPSISPNKTVEGAAANAITCVLVAWALAPVFNLHALTAIATGLSIGIFGQLGDLLESAVKRRVGKKDSGTILPGHGGVLDRIDSFLLASPVAFLLLALLEPGFFNR